MRGADSAATPPPVSPGRVSISVPDTLTAAVYLLGGRNISLQAADNPKQPGWLTEDERKSRRR